MSIHAQQRSLHIAFALYRYFPFGGLQRDMLRIAHACVECGVSVKIFCAEWEGELPAGIAVERLPVSGFTNHAKNICNAKRWI